MRARIAALIGTILLVLALAGPAGAGTYVQQALTYGWLDSSQSTYLVMYAYRVGSSPIPEQNDTRLVVGVWHDGSACSTQHALAPGEFIGDWLSTVTVRAATDCGEILVSWVISNTPATNTYPELSAGPCDPGYACVGLTGFIISYNENVAVRGSVGPHALPDAGLKSSFWSVLEDGAGARVE